MNNDGKIFENPIRNKFHLPLFEEGLVHWEGWEERTLCMEYAWQRDLAKYRIRSLHSVFSIALFYK